MNVTDQEAREALADIQGVADRTRRLLIGGYGGMLLAQWGMLCAVAYLITYLLVIQRRYDAIGWVWWGLMMVGVVGMWRLGRRHPVRGVLNRRIGMFWGALCVYAYVWLMLLYPWNGAQFNLFLITLVMFAYVVIGIFAWRVMLWLGLGVTALILIGYFTLWPSPLLWLWMAACVGGPLTVTGVILMLKARE
jgi:hypothetical protein